MIRSATPAGIAATLCLLTGALLAATPPQVPIFRGATNLVTVDAYPRRQGRVVEGLVPADFEVLEDGVRQAIDQFEFVRVEPVPEAERRDPNTQREMLQLAADPHNRVFVAYLDTYHVSVVGSHNIRAPLVDLLNRIVAPNDLFGVTTPKMPATSLVLGRKLVSVEDQLTRYWAWGERNHLGRDPNDPKEVYLDQCFSAGQVGDARPTADDGGVQRAIADILIDRRREESTLSNLKDLVGYVGTLREARTLLLLVTDGWRLFRSDQALLTLGTRALTGGQAPAPPPIGLTPGARLGANVGLTPGSSDQACMTELNRLALLDDQQTFQDIIALANRKNVVFYPVNPGGLELLDSTIADTGMPGLADMERHRARVASAETLAANTDGIAVTNTNDLGAGLGRIVNDVSAYYLLGYYSTNSKADGKYRRIEVRVKSPNVAVAARRGYLATSAAAAAAARSMPAAAAPTGVDVSKAIGSLSRLESGTSLFTYGVASGKDLAIVVEIASRQVELGAWPSSGGPVRVTASGAAGEKLGIAEGRIEPGARGTLIRVPIGAVAGPWRVSVTATGSGGSLDDALDVRAGTGRLIGEPIVYRGTAGPRAVLRPVADFLFHRTERVHVECAALQLLDRRTARVLDQRGQPLPMEATLTERDDAGQPILVADLNLAPLSPGDYVIEISAGRAAETEQRFVAVRVIR